MILYRATADQEVFFTMIDAETGAAIVGATVVPWISHDGGVQAAGTGTVDELGNGQYRYNFSVLDTDGGTVGLMLLAPDCVPISYSWTTTAPYASWPVAGGAGTRFLTLEQAKAHLRIDTVSTSPMDAAEADLLVKMAAAEHLILDYLKVSPIPWTDETDVPPLVHAAMLLQLGELYRFRGDDDGKADREAAGSLSPMIEGMLRRYRDPALV